MTEISAIYSLLTDFLLASFQNVYHPHGMCSRLLMAKSEMTGLFILVSQRRPSGKLFLMIAMTQIHSNAFFVIALAAIMMQNFGFMHNYSISVYHNPTI